MNFSSSPARLRYPYQKGPVRSVATEATDQDLTPAQDRLFERRPQPQDWEAHLRAKTAPDFMPGLYNNAGMSQSTDNVDVNNKRITSAPPGKTPFNYVIASSSDGSGGNNLSTDGKELYDANSIDGSVGKQY